MKPQHRRSTSFLGRVMPRATDPSARRETPTPLAKLVPGPLHIAIIGRGYPDAPPLRELFAREGYAVQTGLTPENVCQRAIEGQLDLVCVVEPVPGTTLADCARMLRERCGSRTPYLVAFSAMNPLMRRDLALAGFDDVFGMRFSRDRFGQMIVAASRHRTARRDAPPIDTASGAALVSAATLDELFGAMPEAVFIYDSDGRLVSANAAFAHFTGFEHRDIRGARIVDLFPGSHARHIRDDITTIAEQAANVTGAPLLIGPRQFDFTHHDGHLVRAEIVLRSLRTVPAATPLIQGILREVADHARAEQELLAMQETAHIVATEHDLTHAMQKVLETLSEREMYTRSSIWIPSPDGVTLLRQASVGPPVPAEVPRNAGIVGRVTRTRRPVLHVQSDATPSGGADPILTDPDVTSAICVPILHDQRLFGVLCVEAHDAMPLDSSDLSFLNALAIQIAGMIERDELFHTLERQATTDPVTGLPNRQVFQPQLEQAIAHAHERPVSILMIGVDGFKTTNELYGHAIADDILHQVGRVLASRLHEGHLLARYTSDQFIMLMPDVSREDAMTIAETLRIAVATQLFIAAEQVEQLTVSIGASTSPDDADTATALLRSADHAMYLAKRAGCNQTFQSNAAFATLAAAHGRINDLLRQSPRETLTLLIRAMDQRLPEREGHSERVTRYAVAIAEELGMSPEELPELRLAAYIHDIGMMSLPDAVLRKPSSLTEDERMLLRAVPAAARSLLSQLELPESVLLAVVHLRENFDGTGYPSGLKGDDIPRNARIIAVADALDAMTSGRAHRDALTLEQAIIQVQDLAETQFDPMVTRAARRLLRYASLLRDPVGTGMDVLLPTDAPQPSSTSAGPDADLLENLEPFTFSDDAG